MKTPQETSNTTSRIVLLADDSEVIVHELAWNDACQFLTSFRQHSQCLVNGQGEIALDAGNLLDALENNMDLANQFVLKTTGCDQDWLAKRSLSDVLGVVSAGIEVNLAVITSNLNKARNRLAALATAKPTER